MLKLKSGLDIKNLSEGGKILGSILDLIEGKVVDGAIPVELDKLSQELIKDAGCVPSFLNYAPGGHDPFPAALCVSVNSAVVHGLPNNTPIVDGDLVGVDLGLIYKDKYFLDSARTIGVGNISGDSRKLLEVTCESLNRGIEAAQIGSYTGDIGEAIQNYIEGEGFSIVRQLVGHGVGFGVHEEPQVPNYGNRGGGVKIEEGLVIAIEPMVTKGKAEITTAVDGWTAVIASGAMAAHEEHTVAITHEGPQILTKGKD